jgi:outer membrane protein assembly factor BamB
MRPKESELTLSTRARSLSLAPNATLVAASIAIAVWLLAGCASPEPTPAVPAVSDPVAAPAPSPGDPPVSPAPPAAVAGSGDSTPAHPEATAPTRAVEAAAARPPNDPSSVFEAAESDWPMWGGSPSRNLVQARDKGIPSSWDPKTKKNVKWVAALGSQSYGNPVAAGGKILVGTNNQVPRNPKIQGDKGILLCLDASDGKLLWQAAHEKLETGRVNDWPEQGIASSPCVEGRRVCADIEGFLDGENNGPLKNERHQDPSDADFIWILDMIGELNVFPKNLASSSPLIVNDLVYVVTSNGPGNDGRTLPSPRAPSFIAVDKQTGKIVWQSNAPGENVIEGQWSAPAYAFAEGRPQVIFPGGDGILRGLDPLRGTPIWQFDLNPKDAVYEPGGGGTKNVPIGTPVCDGGKVFIGVGMDPEFGEGAAGHFYAIDASKEGDITESGLLWHFGGKDYRRTISTACVKDGLVYAVDLAGFLRCLDEGSGKLYWTHDMLASVWGSPFWVDGKIYLGDEDGDVVVLKAGQALEVLGEVNMGNSIYSTPIAANGVLYVMTRTQLFAIAAESN